jgi:D-methionine transport system ATP-binding protein
MSVMVEFDAVSKSFTVGKRQVDAVDAVSLSIEKGEIFGIIGYSGAGKSTLVRLINGLERATSGRILVDGEDITTLPESRLRHVRGGIGMIFQQFNLLRSRTVAGNVEYPLRIAKWPKEKRKARVAELLDFVGLGDRARSYPEQLSGGQKQRVGIARALATEPKILLADESTSALDPETTQEVLRLLQRVNRELGITVVVITHEMDVIRSIADRVAVLEGGRLIEQGAVFDVFSNPQAAATKSFVSTVLRNQPTSDDLVRLRLAHPGRIVTAEILDAGRLGSVLSDAVNRYGVRFEIIFGGISALQNRSYGSITLELVGDEGGVDALVEDLRAVATITEVAA